MRNLLKADFRRIRKDKMLMIMLIIAGAFAVFTPGMYALIQHFTGDLFEVLFPNNAYSKAHFFAAFTIGNDVGLVVPILLAIVLCKDFSYGTIRNKIISGKSRAQIFLSLFITCTAVMVAVMTIHALLTLGFSLIFFDYQATAFTISDFWYLLESLVFILLTIVFYSALLSWLCASTKNVGIVIVLFVAISLALMLIGTITGAAYSIMAATNANPRNTAIMHFVTRINLANASSYIGSGSAYNLEDVLYLTLPALVGGAGFVGLGLLKFRKKDLK